MKLFEPRYSLFFFLICLSVIACRESPAIDEPEQIVVTPLEMDVSDDGLPTGEQMMTGRRIEELPYPEIVDLQLVRVSTETAGFQLPALMEAKILGRDINSVAFIAGRHEEDGGRRLVTYKPVGPSNHEQDWPIQWPDGTHDLSYVWDTEADYVTDGEVGDFALLWDVDPESMMRSINGHFRHDGELEFVPVVIIVDTELKLASELLDASTGEVIVPASGDQFQLLNLLLDDTGATVTEPGSILTFGQSGELAFERRVLPSGDYFMGIVAEGGAGTADSVFANFHVGNDNLTQDQQVLFQPEHGFQILHPGDWGEIVFTDQEILAGAITNTVVVQIAVQEQEYQNGLKSIGEKALETLGDVQILYQDQLQIGYQEGSRTAYGYESPTGPHTGIFLSFLYGGKEFSVDVDGPAEEEATVLNASETIANGWIWRIYHSSDEGDYWRSVDLEDYETDIPSDLRHNLLNNGWHRFSEGTGDTFFAIRVEPSEASELTTQAEHWLEVASRDTVDFRSSDLYEVQLSDQSWLRVDFQYEGEEQGELWGAIMATEIDQEAIIAWFEAPATDFIQAEESVATLMLADLFNK